MENAQIVNSTFSIVFIRNEQIRKKAFELEEKLKEHFCAPQIIPIPDNAPPEIPRIIFSSLGGHSVLNVSLINVQLTTNFDGEFANDFAKALAYLKDKNKLIVDAFSEYTGGSFIFSGLQTNILIDSDNPLLTINSKFMKDISTENLFESGLKLTYVHQKKYFVNVAINNARIYQGNSTIIENEVLSLSKFSLVKHGIKIVLDINDRYAQNESETYRSSKETIDEIFDLGEDIIKSKLTDLFDEGKLML